MINGQLLFCVLYLIFLFLCVHFFGAGGGLGAIVALVLFYLSIWKN